MNVEFFIAGSIGAIAPEILRLYQIRMTSEIRFSKFYFVISVIYILLGGYVASIFPGLKNSFFAMCIGVGLVTTINTMAKIAGILNKGVKAVGGKRFENIGSQRSKQNIEFESIQAAPESAKTESKGSFWDFTNSL
jgi:hypothetical protein